MSKLSQKLSALREYIWYNLLLWQLPANTFVTVTNSSSRSCLRILCLVGFPCCVTYVNVISKWLSLVLAYVLCKPKWRLTFNIKMCYAEMEKKSLFDRKLNLNTGTRKVRVRKNYVLSVPVFCRQRACEITSLVVQKWHTVFIGMCLRSAIDLDVLWLVYMLYGCC